jgi:broad specificity phosphatase PhoE
MPKLLAILAALIAATASAPAAAADTVYVMRHLQKAEGADPPLSAEGAANAQAVARTLATSGVKALFATPTRRAMETAKPLAAKLGLRVQAYDPGNPDALVSAVAAVPGAVLVVGHSNTVPDLVARFGGKRTIVLTEEDFGTIFAVTPSSGQVATIALK